MKAKTKENKELTFTKTALKNSRKYCNFQDAIEVLVKDNESLTFNEIDERLNNFFNKKGGKKC